MEFDAFLHRRHFLLLLCFSAIIFAAWGGMDMGRQNSAVFEAPLPGGHNANWKALCRAHKPPAGIGMAGKPGKANDGGDELAEEMGPNGGTNPPPPMVPSFDDQTAVVMESIPEEAQQKDVKENVSINKNLNRRRRTGTNGSRKMPLQGFGRTNGEGREKRPKMEVIRNERGKRRYNIGEIFGRRKGKEEDGKKTEGGGMMNGGGRKKAAKNVFKNSKKIEPAENAMKNALEKGGENDGEKGEEEDEENGKAEDDKRTAARRAHGIDKPLLDLVKEVLKMAATVSNQQSTKDEAAAIDEKALLDLMAKNEKISNLLEAISTRQITAEEEAASCRRS